MYPLNLGLAISSPRLWEETQAALQTLSVRVVFEQESIRDVVAFLDKVEKFRPDVLLIDSCHMEIDLADLIPGIKSSPVQPQVIVLREDPSPEDILKAMRAGANEYIYCPLNSGLKEALERIAKLRESSEAASSGKAKTIGFLSAKGGCGATTVACHAAVEFGRLSGKRVLLADFDFASGVIRVLMQVKSRYSVLDAVNNTQRLDASYWRSLVSNGYHGVEVIAGSSTDCMLEYPKPMDVRSVLRFAKQQYDYLLVDLGQGLDAGDLGVLEELDELFLVSTPDIPALQMTKLASQQLNRLGFRKDRVRVLLNRMSRRVELEPGEIESAIGLDVYATLPNDYTALEQAYNSGRLLPDNNHLRESIRRLVRRVGDLSGVDTRRKFTLFGL
jgi:pilus assembly protein CpaE